MNEHYPVDVRHCQEFQFKASTTTDIPFPSPKLKYFVIYIFVEKFKFIKMKKLYKCYPYSAHKIFQRANKLKQYLVKLVFVSIVRECVL